MKKFLIALLSCVTLCFSAVAETGYIDELEGKLSTINQMSVNKMLGISIKHLSVEADMLKPALQAHFPDKTNYGNALAAYHAALKANDNKGILPKQLWDVCAAGGMDIKTAAGKEKCNVFARVLVTGFKRRCFNGTRSGCNRELKWVNVTLRQAINICKVMAKHRWGTKFLACSNVVQGSDNDDYIACKNMLDDNDSSYAEFQFDDVYESVDADMVASMKKAICIIATGKDTCLGAGDCQKVNAVARDLGYSASVKNGICVIDENAFTDASQLINQYPDQIDHFVFSSSKDQTEIQAMGSLDETIKQYCAVKLAPTPVTSFECEKSHRRWKRGTFEDNEDVLRCRINGKIVDFVFDDLTQANVLWSQKKKIEGSLQGLGCRGVGGIFDGKHCADLSEDMCEQVAKANLKDCPTCKQAYWDAEQKICMLPSSKTAANVKTVINVMSKTGVAAVTLVTVVASGGTALAIVAGTAAVTAAAVSDGAKIVMDSKASDWMIEMNKIQTPAQAEAFLRKHLSEIMGAKSLGASRINGVSEMLVRVIKKAPDSMFEEIAAGCTMENGVFNNTLSTCALNPANGNNTLQTVINVADTVHFIAGVVMAVEGLRQVAQTISQRASVVARAKVVDNLKGANKLVYLNPNGTQGTIVANSVLGGSNTAIVANSGLKVGEVVGLTTTGQIVQVAGQGINLASVAGGMANAAVAFSDENLANVQLTGPQSQELTPVPDPKPEEKVVPQPNPKPDPKPNPKPDPKPEPKSTPDSKPDSNSNPNPDSGSNSTSVPASTPVAKSADVPQQSVTTSQPLVEPMRDVDPYQVGKKPNVGLIATAAVAGTLLTGGLIGGLVARNRNQQNSGSSVATPTVPSDIDRLMKVAGGTFGNVDGNSLTLIPLPTTDGTYAPIVDINGRAVVVVGYREYKLPYFLDTTYGTWSPLLGIGNVGGWFNVYQNPTDTGIQIIDRIRLSLNNNITPSVVRKYIGSANNDLQFPSVAPTAYQIINAMFINGVVQSSSGVLSAADQQLYNSNYELVKQLLN